MGFFSPSWIGITDRDFPRRDLVGAVAVSDGNTVFAGRYGNGTFRVTQRCSAASEIGTFAPGDKWVGEYACAEPNARHNEEDVYRAELFVTAVSPDNRVTAVLDFDGNSAVHYVCQRTNGPALFHLRPPVVGHGGAALHAQRRVQRHAQDADPGRRRTRLGLTAPRHGVCPYVRFYRWSEAVLSLSLC